MRKTRSIYGELSQKKFKTVVYINIECEWTILNSKFPDGIIAPGFSLFNERKFSSPVDWGVKLRQTFIYLVGLHCQSPLWIKP